MNSRRGLWLFIVAFSVLIVIAYDLWQIWKSKPQSCELQRQECPDGFACAQAKEGLSARCLPKPAAAPQILELPFEAGTPIQCTAGSESPGKFTTDYSLYGLELRAYPPILDLIPETKEAKPVKILSPASGQLKAIGSEVRILLGNGYYLSMRPIMQPRILEGDVKVGEEIGTLDSKLSDSLILTAHFLNVDLAEKRFSEPEALGLSIPYQLNVSDDPKDSKISRVIRSDQLLCDADSEFRLFRVTSSR